MVTDPTADPTVGELSEGAILRRILARTGVADASLVGPGDDAAVLASTGPIVATTDTLVHGPDFRLAWSRGFDLGWKSAAVNLADVAAMGARPTALLVALAMPDSTRISFVEQLADGLRAACDQLAPGCAVVGGDLTVSQTLTIAVTALGSLPGAPILRSGAQEGDIVAVAGDLGLAARGLAVLFDRATDDAGHPIAYDESLVQTLTVPEREAVGVQLRPSPPIAAGLIAAGAGAHSMMDVSDGLVLDATRMADASGVTIDVNSALVSALTGESDAQRLREALTGGEDHALLATFAPDSVPVGFREIGVVRARGEHAVLVDSVVYDGRGGWDPYRDWDTQTG